MSGTGLPDPERDAPGEPQREAAGAWVGYLIFALILLFLIVLAAQAAYDREWAHSAALAVVTVVLFVVPTGGLRWLRRYLQARKPSP